MSLLMLSNDAELRRRLTAAGLEPEKPPRGLGLDALAARLTGCAALLLDLNSADAAVAEDFALALALRPPVSALRVLLLTDVGTWAETGPAPPSQGGEQEGDEDTWGEDDYALRRPRASCVAITAVEDAFLAIARQQPLLRLTVLCAGVLYGHSASPLDALLRRAWTQDAPLHVVGDGANCVPTLHVADYATHVLFHLRDQTPALRYVFAVDRGPRTQTELVRGVAEALGAGQLADAAKSPAYPPALEQALRLNVRLRAPDRFLPENEEEPALYNWHSRGGVAGDAAALREEFARLHGLAPLRIAVIGCGLTGKSALCRSLADHFRLPLIDVSGVAAEAMRAEDEVGEQLRQNAENEEKSAMPLRALAYLLRRRMRRNDCVLRGYVLDGWPASAAAARALFCRWLTSTPSRGGRVQPGRA